VGSGRGGASMTVTVVLVLAAAFLVVRLLALLVPPPQPNGRMVGGDFLVSAVRSPIRWWRLDREAVEEARRSGLPILLFEGSMASDAARRLDRGPFSNQEAAQGINGAYVPIRVDLDEQPGFRDAILPLSAAEGDRRADCRLWLIDPEIGPLAGAACPGPRDTDLSLWLEESLAAMGRRADQRPNPVAARHIAERQALLEPTLPEESPAVYLTRRISEPDPPGSANPVRWKMLVAAGREEQARAELLAALRSPLCDAVRPTFLTADPQTEIGAEPMKRLDQNLEALRVISWLAAAEDDRLLKRLAVRWAAAISEEFRDSQGWALTLVGRTGDDGRSPAFSIAPGEINRLRPEAAEALGLRDSANGQRVPYPRSLESWLEEDAESLTHLQEVVRLQSLDDRALYGNRNGTATARIAAAFMEAGLLLDDVRLRSEGLAAYGSIQARLVAVQRDARPFRRIDKIDFAEAALMAWMAEGQVGHLDQGRRILEPIVQSRDLLQPDPGLGLGWLDRLPFSPVDGWMEAPAARAGRLIRAYGDILNLDDFRSVGDRLLRLPPQGWTGGSGRLDGIAAARLQLARVRKVLSASEWRRLRLADPSSQVLILPAQ
ncbi:MAG: DUF255 domain-containing protein, partial [Fimbriimonadaceae bacterium]|nr:DUF255 domain-containing protein [Fimbriimonadaceae bacterium]